MDFGLIYELQMGPPPYTPDQERRLYMGAMEQIILADKLGFTHAWEVEHHFLEEWSHSSAPEVFLGAVSQRTSRIRLGQGVALLPGQFNHPVRVAERAAVLDIVSGGRLELGTGRAVTMTEIEGFNIDPATTAEQWEEAIRIIPKMWREGEFEHHGKWFDIPPRKVIPKPIQKPHPPLWLAGTSPDTFEKAGRFGVGMIGFAMDAPDNMRERVAMYHKAVRECENPAGDFKNERIALMLTMHCAPTDEEAIADAKEPLAWEMIWGQKIYAPFTLQKVPGYERYWELAHQGQQFEGPHAPARRPWEADETLRLQAPPVADLVANGVTAIGSPATIRGVIRKWVDLGIDQLLCFVQFGGIAQEKTMRSLELIGKEVLPEFLEARAPSAVAAR